MPATSRRLAATIVLCLLALVASACAGAEESLGALTATPATPTPTATPTPPAPPTPSTTAAPATPATTPTAAPTPASTPEPGRIEIAYRDGQVQVERSPIDAELGEQLTVRVTSDVADEVHVHGYDLTADVGPGQPARISFAVELPGVFEVELEESGVRLVELAVR